ncbi:MAG: hypothetical protein IJ419_10740 [Agathobacter sp.]|nr:hypothetical protein [Agathobacter sp.]
MKKTFTRMTTLLLVLAIALSCLSGCGSFGNAPKLSGTEKAKLLLANQRLDSSVLSSSLNMLTNSDGSLTSSLILPNDDLYATLGGISIQLLEKLGTCNKNGDTYEWKAFDDYCNIDSFFDSYMLAIEGSVEQASAMIDHLKTDVNVVDKWIGYKDEGNAYMLSVEGSTDTLYEKLEGGYRICKRTTNSKAENVYELFQFGDTSTGVPEDVYETMVYVPGQRYEFSLDMGEQMNLYLVLEKIDGEWNMLCMSAMPTHVNVTNLVTTKDITYVYDYSVPKSSSDPLTSILSLATADRGCDLIRIQDSMFSMFLHGYKGINSMKVTASSNDIVSSDGMYGTYGTVIPSIILSNGSTIEPNQTMANGTVSYLTGYAGVSADGYILTADFRVEGDSMSERLNNYKTFLAESGITCKVNIDKVISYALKGEKKLGTFLGSYKWNGYTIDTYSNIIKAIEAEKESFQTFVTMYNNVKNNEFVDLSLYNQSAINGVDFAKIDTLNKGTLTWNDEAGTVSVSDMSMTISDNTLLEAGTQYTIVLGYAQKDAADSSKYDPCSICPLLSENYTFTTYSEGNSFTVTQNATFNANVEFDTTDFDLVACIVTADGIRVSEIVTIE